MLPSLQLTKSFIRFARMQQDACLWEHTSFLHFIIVARVRYASRYDTTCAYRRFLPPLRVSEIPVLARIDDNRPREKNISRLVSTLIHVARTHFWRAREDEFSPLGQLWIIRQNAEQTEEWNCGPRCELVSDSMKISTLWLNRKPVVWRRRWRWNISKALKYCRSHCDFSPHGSTSRRLSSIDDLLPNYCRR